MPEAFGLIGMVAVFINVSKTLANGGFSASLIRVKDISPLDYSTVFTLNILFAIVLYGVLFFTAPTIANFYNETILSKLIRIMGLILLLNPFSMIPSTMLNRKLKFKEQFYVQFPSMVISSILALFLAYNGYGIWSLVWKELTFSVMSILLLFYFVRWKPLFGLDKAKLRFHFGFGSKLMITSLLQGVANNVQNIVIGKVFSVTDLGFYSRAKSMESLPTQFVFNGLNRVAYPLISASRNNQAVVQVHSNILQMVFYVLLPIQVISFVIGEPLFIWLLTEKWSASVPYFQLLLIASIFFPLIRFNQNLFMLLGKGKLLLTISVLQNILLLALILSVMHLGITQIIYCLIGVNVVSALVSSWYVSKYFSYGIKRLVNDTYSIFILNLILGIVFYILQSRFFDRFSIGIDILLVAGCFLAIYFLISFLLKFEVIGILRKNWNI